MFVGCRVLFGVVCCWLLLCVVDCCFGVCCLLRVVCCLLCVVWWLLRVGWCVMFDG